MTERPGLIRLQALPAPDVWHALGTFTFYSSGPRSTLTVRLAPAGLEPGDLAGLVLACRPCAWLGVERLGKALALAQFDEQTGGAHRARLTGKRLWLRAECDFTRKQCIFRYSADGRRYARLHASGPVHLPEGSQAVAISLFSCTTTAGRGGYADFEDPVLTAERHDPSGAR